MYIGCSDNVNTKTYRKQEKVMAKTTTIQTRVDPKTKEKGNSSINRGK